MSGECDVCGSTEHVESWHDRPPAVPIYDRPDISVRDLAVLRRQVREMSAALARIQEMAEEDIRLGVVTSKSSLWQIEADARAAIGEVKA